MRLFYIGVTLLCGTYAVGHAEERLAEKPQCATLVAKVVQATNATFDRYSPSGQNVFLTVSGTKSGIMIECNQPGGQGAGVSLGFDGAYPSNAWFALAVRAGAVETGAAPARLEAAIRKCHLSALKDKKWEMGEIELPRAKVECQAFTRDGGGVSLSIWQVLSAGGL